MKLIVNTDVGYLPTPNRIELILTNRQAPPHLTMTSFLIPVDGNEAILAQNQRRGLEIAGGHREGRETLRRGARREGLEEVGCTVGKLVPIGYLRMVSEGPRPKGWRYPHPVSYQQFFAAPLIEQHPYRDNTECAQPVRVNYNTELKLSVQTFVREALRILSVA